MTTKDEPVAKCDHLAEQAEQEPVGYYVTAGRRVSDGMQVVFDDNEILYATPQPVKQEPVGYFAYDEEHDIWEELTGPNAPGATPLYAAPVQQVDLTDGENPALEVLKRIVHYYDLSKTGSSLPSLTTQAKAEHENTMFGAARAVIATYKGKQNAV